MKNLYWFLLIFLFLVILWICTVFSRVFYLFLPILLGELDSDVVAAECEASILTLIGAGRIITLEVFDEGEALDGAEVGAAFVHIFRDVDVLDGAILLEHSAQVLNAYITWQVACDDGLDARGVRRYNTIHFSRGNILDEVLDSRALSKCYTAAVRANGKEIRLTLLRFNRGSACARLVITYARDVTPSHRAVP
jgi:hypothetical protein